MSKKFALIGAGSFSFTRALVRDILSFKCFEDATIALMDIDAEKLEYIRRACQRILDEGHYPAKLIATLDRKEALMGADGVITTILQGGTEVWQHDVLIPKKYGVDMCIGDTRGISGIFRYLRTINPIMEIADDIVRYCPNAIYLNYTNPMAMLCRTVQGKYPQLVTSGLCHSVQGTAQMLAEWVGAKEGEYTYTCAGINHQAFYTKFEWNGRDVLPMLRKLILEDPEVYQREPVRNEMFLSLGYYPTESSGHNSEYNAWFRKRPDLIEKYCTYGTNWNPGIYAASLERHRRRDITWRQDIEDWFNEPLDLNRGKEYAAYIFNAVFGDHEEFHFNGNLRNFGLIDNLPEGCCVEIPVVASKNGLKAIPVGKLPPQIALLSGISAQIEEMVVEASMSGDTEMLTRAVYFDPICSAVCSMEEIRSMVNELLEINRPWLPQFFHD